VATPRGRRRLATLTIFLLAAVTLLAIGGPVRRAGATLAHAIVSPFVSVVRGVTKPIGDAFAGAFNYADVVAQNHVLARELAQLRMEQAENAYEHQQLHDVLALERLPFLSSIPVATAQLTAQNLSDFQATIQIDKGSSAGVLVGMPVVGGAGLVGLVTATTSGGATVTLLTDATSSVGVSFGNGHYDAVLHGQGPGRDLAMDFVAPGTPVHVNELVYTDGLQGGLFPAGIPVGRIAVYNSRRGATQLSVSLQPLARLDNLDYVDVVLWEPGS